MTDFKFRWYADMFHDEGLSISQRAIIGYVGIRYARAPEFEFCVTQATIAGNLHVRRATVSAAMSHGESRGWLRRVGVRQRGRGHRGADTWQLARPPEIGTWTGTSSKEMGTPSGTHCGEIGTPDDRNTYAGPQKDVRETAERCTPTNSSNWENGGPKGTEKGLLEEVFQIKDVSADGADMAHKEDARRYSDLFGGTPALPAAPPLPRERVEPIRDLVPCIIDGCTSPGRDEFGGLCGRHEATSRWGSG